ncbi:ribonuclease Z [Virgibacillus sp. YIM 98842]|uniref:ribonuclease Z n=1 Tax=Virgibacillus sp. YIM 98842 TaxID=2663533 RepID=UPI0013DBDD43|nr:ribonuclease Z [Virgibacillus sp. YIM 98842]
MELLFLGTGAGIPSKERNVSSIALKLLQELNSIWLFDCGEATQHQILHTSIKPGKISKIFITHMHGDHIFGLPGVLSSRSFQGGEESLTIYGPKGIKEYTETALRLSRTSLTYPLIIEEISEGFVFENDSFTVYAKELDHRIPSFGFRIVEKNKPGTLLADKLKNMGIEPGPVYQQIKENEQVALENGTVIYRNDVVGPEKPGKVITILGDTRAAQTFSEFVHGSDILVHESTFNHENRDLAYKYFHSTAVEAAELAKKSQCSRLILTHVSSRYQNKETAALLLEAQQVFPNTALAHDFLQLKI